MTEHLLLIDVADLRRSHQPHDVQAVLPVVPMFVLRLCAVSPQTPEFVRRYGRDAELAATPTGWRC